MMPYQAPNIDVKPGDKGRLVYDKVKRTIVAERPVSDISDRLRDRAAHATEADKGLLYDAADVIDSLRMRAAVSRI